MVAPRLLLPAEMNHTFLPPQCNYHEYIVRSQRHTYQEQVSSPRENVPYFRRIQWHLAQLATGASRYFLGGPRQSWKYQKHGLNFMKSVGQ
jgi:hypothetical protein